MGSLQCGHTRGSEGPNNGSLYVKLLGAILLPLDLILPPTEVFRCGSASVYLRPLVEGDG